MTVNLDSLALLAESLSGEDVSDIDVADLTFDQIQIPLSPAIKAEIAAMMTLLGYSARGRRYRVWKLNPMMLCVDFDHERKVLDLRERFAKRHT